MADIVDRATRSRMMSGIRGRDTKPEIIVRKYLHAHGFRYRIAPRNLPGRPDIVLPKYRTIVFVHGCFWHGHVGCKLFVPPSSNSEFWKVKIGANQIRDRHTIKALASSGWNIAIFWECATKNRETLAKCLNNLSDFIRGNDAIRNPANSPTVSIHEFSERTRQRCEPEQGERPAGRGRFP